MDRFRRPSAGERLRQLGYLLKHSFTVVGRDRDILVPLFRMWIYAAALVSLFFGALLAFATDAGGWGLILLTAAVSLFIYKYFYYNRQELAQSWLVFETACGRDRAEGDARQRVAGLRGQARRLALLDMVAAWVASRRSNGDSGLAGAAVNLLLAGLNEVWDLANHFLLPAVAVDGLDLREGASRLTRVRDNVPETLVGVFGIDIMGRAVGTIMAPIYAILVAGGITLGLWLGDTLPAAFSAGALGALFPGEFPGWLPVGPDTQFTWLPLFVCIWIGKLAGSLFERGVTSVKVIYFTLFYARIMHSEALDSEVRSELEGYLRLEDGEPARETADASAGG